MSFQVIQSRKTVFIVGAARSGTTWLQFLLQQSPCVAGTSNETHLFDIYVKRIIGAWNNSKGKPIGIWRLLSEEEFGRWIEHLVRTCLARIAESKPEATIILEKTPRHCECAQEILGCLPDSYFIHIIRDPRAVVASVKAASGGWGAHWAPTRIRDACGDWASLVTQAHSIAALTPHYYELFYEQLHADTPRQIVRLFDWLNTPIDRSQAEAFAAACDLDSLRREATTGAASGKVPEPAQFFRRGEVDSWRTELTPTEIALIERLTKKHMARLGYEPVSGRRAKLAASARLSAYKSAVRVERAAHGLTEWLRP